jgi:site-specific DNA recombinase
VEAFCQRVHASLETATFARQEQRGEDLSDRLIVTGDEVEIRYVIPTSQRGEDSRLAHVVTSVP